MLKVVFMITSGVTKMSNGVISSGQSMDISVIYKLINKIKIVCR